MPKQYIKQLNGYYIKDEEARTAAATAQSAADTNAANLILSKLYVNVKEHGVKGDGITDDTEAIQSVINDNPHRTIFFPDGTYLISAPLTIGTNNAVQVNLKLSENAIIKTDTTIDSLIEVGKEQGEWNRRSEGAVVVIDGGILDAANTTQAILLSSNRKQTVVKNLEIYNVSRYGIYIGLGTNTSESADANIESVNINGVGSEGDSTGIYLAAYDNKIRNVRVNSCTIGIHERGGSYFQNVHCLGAWGKGQLDKTNYEKTIAFKLQGGGVSKFNQCYADTFGVGFEFNTAQKVYLVNCQAYWYLNNLEYTTVLFKNREQYANLRLYVTDFDFTPPSVTGEGKNIGLDLSSNNSNFRQYLTVFDCFHFNHFQINEIGRISVDDYLNCRSLHEENRFTLRDAWSRQMEANKYYPIAILRGGSVYDLTINMATDQTIRAVVLNAANPTITIENLKSSSHANQYSLAVCNSEVVDDVRTAYLCVKTTANDCSLNAHIQGFKGWNNQLFTRRNYGYTALENPTVNVEVGFNNQ